jgi:hypothetical protein
MNKEGLAEMPGFFMGASPRLHWMLAIYPHQEIPIFPSI